VSRAGYPSSVVRESPARARRRAAAQRRQEAADRAKCGPVTVRFDPSVIRPTTSFDVHSREPEELASAAHDREGKT